MWVASVMSGRLKRSERRLQVARVALDLLAEVSPERLTTRRVAEAAGVTQPALFKHFASREEILGAAIDYARCELEQTMGSGLPRGATPRQVLLALIETLFEFTARFPGLPRLFFYRAAGGEALAAKPTTPLEELVVRLVSMVAAQLEVADLPLSLDRHRAAELLIATMQGELLRSSSGLSPARATAAPALMDHWWAGLEAGQPAVPHAEQALIDDCAAEPPQHLFAITVPTENLVVFDARPLLDIGMDPFESAMSALDRVTRSGALLFTAPFRPTPLMSVMSTRGFAVELLHKTGPVVLVARGPELPPLADLSNLEAPEPLEAVLLATATLAPGTAYLARLPRHPALLLPRLAERGFTCVATAIIEGDPSVGTLLHVHSPERPNDD